MNGRIKNWFWKGALLGLVVLLATSCERPLKLQVVLDRDEAVQEGATVYVDAVRLEMNRSQRLSRSSR